jgi:hypothetical protein
MPYPESCPECGGVFRNTGTHFTARRNEVGRHVLLELGCQNTTRRYWWDFTSGASTEEGRPSPARRPSLATSVPGAAPAAAASSNGVHGGETNGYLEVSKLELSPDSDSTSAAGERAGFELDGNPPSVTPAELTVTHAESTVTLVPTSVTPREASVTLGEASGILGEATVTPGESSVAAGGPSVTRRESAVTPRGLSVGGGRPTAALSGAGVGAGQASGAARESSVTTDKWSVTTDKSSVTAGQAVGALREAGSVSGEPSSTAGRSSVTAGQMLGAQGEAGAGSLEPSATAGKSSVTAGQAGSGQPEAGAVSPDSRPTAGQAGVTSAHASVTAGQSGVTSRESNVTAGQTGQSGVTSRESHVTAGQTGQSGVTPAGPAVMRLESIINTRLDGLAQRESHGETHVDPKSEVQLEGASTAESQPSLAARIDLPGTPPGSSVSMRDAFVRQLQLDRLTLRQMRGWVMAEEARRAIEVAAGATEATYERLALILFGVELAQLLGKQSAVPASSGMTAEERLELQRDKARIRARLRRAATKAARQQGS